MVLVGLRIKSNPGVTNEFPGQQDFFLEDEGSSGNQFVRAFVPGFLVFDGFGESVVGVDGGITVDEVEFENCLGPYQLDCTFTVLEPW